MRKLVVISDVHANADALDVVLEKTAGEEIICLGDFVDYGAEPNEVIDRLRETGARSILGNHDAAALTGDTSKFNPKAAMSSIWTKERLSVKSREYLGALPEDFKMRVEDVDFYFAHGSPDDHLWEYVDPRMDSDLFGFFLGRLEVEAMGLGHTHIPYVWKGENGIVFNPGSVGQPRDGDRRAAYALVEVDGSSVNVDLHRAEYDVEKAASKIRGVGLPASHAERLSTGT